MSIADNVYPFRSKPAFNKLRCPKCDMETEAACNCGVDYVQAKELAAQAIALNPELSTREIAREIGVSQMTVVRAGDGLKQNVSNRHPREIAAEAIKDNPGMTNKDIGENYGICRSTVGKVRKLIEAGEPIIPPKTNNSTCKPKESDEASYNRRLEEFRRHIGVLASACTSSQGMEIPHLSAEDAQDAIDEIKSAAVILRTLLAKLNEALKGTQS